MNFRDGIVLQKVVWIFVSMVFLTMSACSGCEDPAQEVRFFEPLVYGDYVFDGVPKIEAPERVFFADVEAGQSRTEVVRITNVGKRTLKFGEAEITSGFELGFGGDGVPNELPRGEHLEIRVTYFAQHNDEFRGTLSIESNDPEVPIWEIDLYANAKLPCLEVDPLRLDFGSLPFGEGFAERTLRLSSCSSNAETQVVLTGVSGDVVFRVEGRRLGQDITLAAGEHVDLVVTFDSNVSGRFEGLLHIETNDEIRPRVDVELAAVVAERGCPTAIIEASVAARPEVAVADPETTFRALPLDDVILDASASFDDHGTVAQYRWSLVSKPVDSQARLDASEGQLSGLWLDLAGTYVVEMEVENEEGTSSCQPARMTIESVANEDIHLQLVWDTPNDPDQSDSSGSDLDLHLLHPQGRWNERPFDCFWQNMEPDWATPESDDDPSLDIDDVDGWGPENINLDNPEDGANYGVGVHYFADHGYSVSFVTVRIYIDGILRSEFLRRRLSDQNFWYVADLRWPTGDVEEIDTVHASFPD